MSRVALLVMTDGRRAELDQTIQSAEASLRGNIVERYLHDDTGDEAYRRQLIQDYPQFWHIGYGPRRGFGGAIAHAWQAVGQDLRADFVFHLEADFTFNRQVDLGVLADVLVVHPHLAQMALRRQAWSPEEVAAGGVVQMWPDAYAECELPNGSRWLAHRLFYTTNPHLVDIGLVRRGWPDVPRSETAYTQYLLREGIWRVNKSGIAGINPQAVRFGYWGAREDAPWVHHIGHTRTGTGY